MIFSTSQLMHKLSVEAPPKILVERYLIEIAKNYNVPYEPDSVVMVSQVGRVGGASGLTSAGGAGHFWFASRTCSLHNCCCSLSRLRLPLVWKQI